MKKRCAHCDGKLGLGMRFKNYWCHWMWHHKRFCSLRCESVYEKESQVAKEQRTWYAFINES